MRGDSLQLVDVTRTPWHSVFKSNYSDNSSDRVKLYAPVLVFAITFVTLCNLFAKNNKISYRDVKYRQIFLKTRKPQSESKMLLTLSKILVCFCVFASYKLPTNQGPTFSDLSHPIGTKQLFSYEFFSFCDNMPMLDKNMSLYALSKLKLRKRDSFFKYLLLLSGDVNLNPGPIQNPCKRCLGSANNLL